MKGTKALVFVTGAIDRDRKYWILDSGHRTLDTGHWTLGCGHWTGVEKNIGTVDTDRRYRILDTEMWTLDRSGEEYRSSGHR